MLSSTVEPRLEHLVHTRASGKLRRGRSSAAPRRLAAGVTDLAPMASHLSPRTGQIDGTLQAPTPPALQRPARRIGAARAGRARRGLRRKASCA
ncbi:MAG: hypothetical protein MZW92_58055 [Comamonadaceae bacterium]|nr:hypothetical protein [Comamonadaceae bacterium]